MEFSILTPLHSLYNRYIGDAYDSLVNQTHREWEWIIIVNNGGEVPDRIRQNPAVVVVTEPEEGNGIGRLKRLAASRTTKQVLVELDADLTSVVQVHSGYFYPDGVKICWTAFTITINGVDYDVVADAVGTDDNYVYWNSASPTVFAHTDDVADFAGIATRYLVAHNNAGVITSSVGVAKVLASMVVETADFHFVENGEYTNSDIFLINLCKGGQCRVEKQHNGV